MSRWGRGRGASVAVPLEHLFRENSNCPSAARSAGTVGKWGITSFTSTRSAPYSFGGGGDVGSFQRKPKQDQNSPLTVPALEANAPPPKPKKFFKSRNVDSSENAALPTSSVAPPPADKAFPSFSKREDKPAKPQGYAKKPPKVEAKKDKMEIPKLKIQMERSPKSNKSKFFASKAAGKEEAPVEEKPHLSPNKRYLVRNRDKIINYSEDRSNSPPPVGASTAGAPLPPSKVSSPKTSPALPLPSLSHVKPGLMSPTNKDGKPPIVLRISKGTSRLLSTDSEEVLTSPNADRSSFSESIMEAAEASHEGEPVLSPAAKQEGIKITIKCYSGNKEKPSKGKAEKHSARKSAEPEADVPPRATRASRRNQHKGSEEEARGCSPVPGSDNYELYRTLASPGGCSPLRSPRHSTRNPELPPCTDNIQETSIDDDVEMSLAQLEAGKLEPTVIKNGVQIGKQIPKKEVETDKGENSGGRAMRHRSNINYNENAASFIDDVTATRFNRNPAKSYSRKTKKKAETPPTAVSEETPMEVGEAEAGVCLAADTPAESQAAPAESEAPAELGGPSGSADTETTKLRSSKRIVHKISTLDYDQRPSEPEDFSESVTEKTTKLGEKSQCKVPDKHVFKSPKRLLSESSPDSKEAEDKPSVKLVITKKKGSIFKSRSLVNDGPGAAGKKRHLYKHKWADDGKGGQTPRPEPEPSLAQVALQEFEESQSLLTRVTRYQKDKHPALQDDLEPYTSVKCPKNSKEYYTVVRNVKKAHQIQEIGEFQEFNDDVEYILDALKDNNPMSTRCLSAITLASKCTAPAFRMHVRAHGTVAKFFRALHDAANDQSLGLCTATVMFVLSQDRLNMDLDRESLELMLNLLESDVSHKDALDDCGLTSVQLAKNKERVQELCAEIKSEGKAKHLDVDNITVGHLAMETLLSLTSKRAGEWFKEELRVLGGVDHILSTICDCCRRIGDYVGGWSAQLLDLLRKVERCMRVLENITQQNEENQTYLLEWRAGLAVDTLVRLFRLCDREIPLYPTGSAGGGGAGGAGHTVRDAILPTLKVLVNLTHPFRPDSVGSTVVGKREGIIDASLHLLLQAPNYLPEQNNFEFSVCVLLLLINLMQNNEQNMAVLLSAQAPADHEAVYTSSKPAVQALIDHFYRREELARLAEKNTDAILDGEKVKGDEPKEKKIKSNDEFIEETVAKLLQKAGTHMEHTMVASYMVLLLGHVVMASPQHEAAVRQRLPHGSFQDMLTVLRKYFSFLSLTASAEATSVAHVKSTEKIIDYLDKCDKLHQQSSGEGSQQAPPSCSGSPAHPASHLDTTATSTSESDKMSSSADMDSSFN